MGLAQSIGMALEAKMTKAPYTVYALQNDGRSDDIMPMEPIDRKFEAFNWRVVAVDGHDMKAVVAALGSAGKRTGKPPSDDELATACKDIAGGCP